jgi:serine/threonine-protein kinase
VILRCLEKEPDGRFKNLAELAQELEPFGSADAAARVKRIRDIIAKAGESIRPPTPSGTIEVRPSVIAESLSRARALTTGGRAATMLTARTTESHGQRRRSAFAWGAALACASVVALVSLHRAAPSPSLAGTAQAAARTVVALPPAPEPAPAQPTAAIAASIATTVTPSAAIVSSAVRPRPSLPRPTPTPPSDRRMLFGDRK